MKTTTLPETVQEFDIKVSFNVLKQLVILDSFYPSNWSQERRDAAMMRALDEVLNEDEFDTDNWIEMGKVVELKMLSNEADLGFATQERSYEVTQDPVISNFEMTGSL